MEYKITGYKPEKLFQFFEEISAIPRGSGNEKGISDYLVKFAGDRGLWVHQDDAYNVIIKKGGSKGAEDKPAVMLQGHIDMVPQKNADKVHDFEKDPITTLVDGDWVRADGTTLGADNGLGVAVALSVLESRDLKHGPVEVLVTVDEETGMTGANALKPGLLDGDILINLDSETEGELYVGCAGGLDATASLKYEMKPAPAGYKAYRISAKGMKGGHSGMDIILYRANANKVLARVLVPLLRDGVKLVSVDGGNMRNAIPREAFADVLVPEGMVSAVESHIASVQKDIRNEYAATDPYAGLLMEPLASIPASYIDDAVALAMFRAVNACPNGVWRMSDAVPGLVETSNNVAIVSAADGLFQVKTLMRSSVDSEKEALAEEFRSLFELAGAETSFTGGYSGWAPNSNSLILHTMKKVYSGMYGKEPAVMAIHAGLECGILGGTYPHWDMVSCGPTILSPHSPDERVNIPSVKKWWDFLVKVLEEIPEK